MKKYYIIFLLTIIVFVSLNKKSIYNNSSELNVSNSISNVTTYNNSTATIPYIDNSLITFSVKTDNTAKITLINASSLKGKVYIPPKVKDSSGKEYVVTELSGTGVSTSNNIISIFGSGYGWGSGSTASKNNTITEIIIPSTVTTISYFAFVGMNAVTTLIIPESVTSITTNGLQGLTGCQNLYILGNVTTLPGGGLNGAYTLKNIYYFGDGITSVGDKLFGDDILALNLYTKDLTSYNLTMTSFKESSLYSTYYKNIVFVSTFSIQYSKDYNLIYNYATKTILLSTIENVLLDVEETTLVPSIIDGYKINTISNKAYTNNAFIINLDIEEGITTIEDTDTSVVAGAFRGAQNLANINLPSSLTYIGGKAFYDTHCTINNTVNIVFENVTFLGNSLFNSTVETIDLGSKIEIVDGTCFSYATNLKEIYVNSDSIISFTSTGILTTTKIIFSSKSLYDKKKTIFSTVINQCVYKVELQYQMAGLLTTASLTDEFLDSISDHYIDNKYIYYSNDEIKIPTKDQFKNVQTGTELELFTDNTYKSLIVANSSTDGKVKNSMLVTGKVDDVFVIYCNLYKDINQEYLDGFDIFLYDENNQEIQPNFSNINLNEQITFRLSSYILPGMIGLPLSQYTYVYTWSKKVNSVYQLLVNTTDASKINAFEVNTTDAAFLNTTYRCTLNIYDQQNNRLYVISKEIKCTYNKETIEIKIYDQKTDTFSNVYNKDYIAYINNIALSIDDMNKYFNNMYTLIMYYKDNQKFIGFNGILSDDYKDEYTVEVSKEGSYKISKTSSVLNLSLFSVGSGLFVINIIVVLIYFKSKKNIVNKK